MGELTLLPAVLTHRHVRLLGEAVDRAGEADGNDDGDDEPKDDRAEGQTVQQAPPALDALLRGLLVPLHSEEIARVEVPDLPDEFVQRGSDPRSPGHSVSGDGHRVRSSGGPLPNEFLDCGPLLVELAGSDRR